MQTTHSSHAWCTSCIGQFPSRESARFRIIVQNDFAKALARAHTCTNARSSCKPFNAATQWGSVSNAALDYFFFAWKQGALCRCVRAFFEPSSCKNHLKYIVKHNDSYPISACVCFADLSKHLFYFWCRISMNPF